MKIYFWALFYKILLEVIYAKIVSPIYGVYGLIWNPNTEYLVLSYFLFFLLLFLLPKNKDKPSYYLVQLLFFTTVIPLLCFFWQTSDGLIYVFYVTVCFIFLFLLLRFVKPITIPYLLIENPKNKSISLAGIIFIISLLIVALLTIKLGGIDVRAFNFQNVYEMRAEKPITGVWAYLVNWASKLFIPFCIVTYMINKKKVMLILSCLMQVYMYLCTGSKTILFSVVLIIGCTYLLKKNNWVIGIPKFYSLIIVGSALTFFITQYLMVVAIFPTRQLIIPAQNSIIHYNFFSTHQKLFFSEGMIGKIFGLKSPYNIQSTFLVSPIQSVNLNTGFLADAYDNAGFIGMMIYTALLAIIINFIDSISRKSNERYKYTALLVYSIVILNDGSLLTALFSWGLGFLLVILYIVASQENNTLKSVPS